MTAPETQIRPICGAQWPNLGPAGGLWTCTLDAGHDGDHEAHGPAGLCADRSAVIPQGHEAILEDRDMTETEADYRCPDCGRETCTGEDCYWPDEAGVPRPEAPETGGE